MSSPHHVVNRTLLALCGAVLLAGGLLGVSSWSVVAERLPSWWPSAQPGSVLPDRAGLGELRHEGWWTPVVIAGAATVLLASLLVLWFQAAAGRAAEPALLTLARPDVTVRTRALADALTRDVCALPLVADGRVRVRGGPVELRARIRLRLEPGAEPRTVLRQLSERTLAEARASVAPRRVRTEVRVSVRSHRARRAL
ncbi:hypothetical protein ACF06W_02990 [Streptomyces albus]|uniref:hypothetical protein n=1 Tax=Streptomyces albus TaxID=1888 RepID=UPI003702D7EF